MKNHSRILIISHQTLVRDGIKHLLQGFKNIKVVGEISFSGADKAIKDLGPNMAIIHLSLYDLSKIIYIRLFLRRSEKLKILIITELTHSIVLKYLFKMGILGCLTMNTNHEELEIAIHAIYNNQKYINDYIGNYLTHNQISILNLLTRRELEVFLLRISGLNIDMISKVLFLGKKSVFTHQTTIIKKLSLKNEIELIQLGSREGLLPILTQ